MELDRNTIILLCIGFIIVWVVFKRFTKKPQQPQDPHQQRHAAPAATPGNGSFDLDKWFGRAQDVIGIMADTRRTDLEAQWREMDEERQLILADEFLRRSGAEADAARLSEDERRRVGLGLLRQPPGGVAPVSLRRLAAATPAASCRQPHPVSRSRRHTVMTTGTCAKMGPTSPPCSTACGTRSRRRTT